MITSFFQRFLMEGRSCKHKAKSLRWLEALINTWISLRCLDRIKHILPNGVKQMVIYHGTIRKISLKQIQVRVLLKLLNDHGYLTYNPCHPFFGGTVSTARCGWMGFWGWGVFLKEAVSCSDNVKTKVWKQLKNWPSPKTQWILAPKFKFSLQTHMN